MATEVPTDANPRTQMKVKPWVPYPLRPWFWVPFVCILVLGAIGLEVALHFSNKNNGTYLCFLWYSLLHCSYIRMEYCLIFLNGSGSFALCLCKYPFLFSFLLFSPCSRCFRFTPKTRSRYNSVHLLFQDCATKAQYFACLSARRPLRRLHQAMLGVISFTTAEFTAIQPTCYPRACTHLSISGRLSCYPIHNQPLELQNPRSLDLFTP